MPQRTVVTAFRCGDAGTEYWAGGTATPQGGGRVAFFAKSVDGRWVSVPAGEVCGTASAGLPQAILNYCNDVS